MADKKDTLKPGEPAFQLKIEPTDDVVFKGKLGEVITVERTITNTSDVRQCFKIKCTANDIFRVRQPLGFIEPKETTTIKISFIGKTAPDAKKHFFAFYHIASDKKTDSEKNPRMVWTADAKPLGVARHNCKFELAEAEKKEEKKEEEKEEKKEEEEKKE